MKRNWHVSGAGGFRSRAYASEDAAFEAAIRMSVEEGPLRVARMSPYSAWIVGDGFGCRALTRETEWDTADLRTVWTPAKEIADKWAGVLSDRSAKP